MPSFLVTVCDTLALAYSLHCNLSCRSLNQELSGRNVECFETSMRNVLISLYLDEFFLKVHFALKFCDLQSKRGFYFLLGFSASLLWFESVFIRQVNLAFLSQIENTLKSCLLFALPWEYFVPLYQFTVHFKLLVSRIRG